MPTTVIAAKTHAHAPRTQRRIYRLRHVMASTGFGRAWIYQLMADGKFPKAIRIGKRAVGWDGDLVDQWVADRLEGR
ncbi:transcriptional regulator, AlpA family [Ectopseudomonas chengduensis]|uniref:Transcriptional regulator, AlpA family n=1 Tax=Ectopseudomonas chengduensis TaxID=489632 RepID=A0A1G6UB58_9GAMM|nr:AlpA family transcriptional regulator [Pseudomonas chengduensis]SDD38598.1 transcriptional regulator, AlpA family [Pseudomonas chengduensis]